MEYRIERDTMGAVKVPKDVLWGAQTQRSLENFPISSEIMPKALIDGMIYLKKACAKVNYDLGKLSEEKFNYISKACEKILEDKIYDAFPLKIWQTGSGTQTNMNLNEVIANLGNQLKGEKLLHPNDDVNMSQSSNDTFPSGMNIGALMLLKSDLIPSLQTFIQSFKDLAAAYPDVIKSGRTHLMDATPISFAQEVSGWRSMLEANLKMIEEAKVYLYPLAIGGTAVGTGINAPSDFGVRVARILEAEFDIPFLGDGNKFYALTSKDAFVYVHGALKALATNLMKIANDIRLLGSGPRCGLGELLLPENEPGSSIMPGKVNPTQCESLTMVAAQVMGNDTTISIGSSLGQFQLNVFMPVIIYNFIQSTILLADGMDSFRLRCVEGIQVNEEKMKSYLDNTLMTVTALNPYIGYDKAAKVAKLAHKNNWTLKEAMLELKFMTEEEFDKAMNVKNMI